jgi:hypothetical protein
MTKYTIHQDLEDDRDMERVVILLVKNHGTLPVLRSLAFAADLVAHRLNQKADHVGATAVMKKNTAIHRAVKDWKTL